MIHAQTTAPPGTPKLALVVGNAAYKNAPLTNPLNDAQAMRAILQEYGFDVLYLENATQAEMQQAIRKFGEQLRKGGIGLFYFSGHGVQIKGRNYLIPLGARLTREDEVAYFTIDAQAVLDKMEAAKNDTNIVILDACRDNPFVRNSKTAQLGLAQIDAPSGTLIAYATAPGSVASDGLGLAKNGLYTGHLLQAMRHPGLKLEDVFKQVRAAVRRDSNGAQVPWESTSLESDFYFRVDPSAATRPNGSGVPDAADSALWEAVAAGASPAEISIYLRRYPQGKFAAEARRRLALLDSAAYSQAPAAGETSQVGTSATLPPGTQTIAPVGADPRPDGSAAASNPELPKNSVDFAVGDRWRYQVVDKFKGEVVRNYVITIDRMLPDGSVLLNTGQLRWDAHGNLLGREFDNIRESYSGYRTIPPVLEAGAKTPIEYEVRRLRTSDQARMQTDRAKGTMVVKGREKVVTPAGEFEAWRVEVIVYGTSTGQSFADNYRLSQGGAPTWRWTFDGWYVPALHAYAAYDEEIRMAAGIQNSSTSTYSQRERHELTSFSLQTPRQLSMR